MARGLLGKVLVHGDVESAITEVEAYLPYGDPAAHVYRGRTERTRVVFGPPGHAYLYLNYGLHWMLNVVAEEEGVPGCVLIRSTERFQGPGRLTKGFGLDGRHYGSDLTAGPLYLLEGEKVEEFDVTPRIGITKGAERMLRWVKRKE